MRDLLAFVGAVYGTAVALGASFYSLIGTTFGLPLRFGLAGTGGLGVMGVGIALYGVLKFASDDRP